MSKDTGQMICTVNGPWLLGTVDRPYGIAKSVFFTLSALAPVQAS